MKKITLIAAMDKKNAIGYDNQLLWHIPEDFTFFKKFTSGKPIIMGRKTWESLPKKPLPDRLNIVLTRNNQYQVSGAVIHTQLTHALEHCKDEAEICIIGGSEIYNQAMPYATDLRITEVDFLAPLTDSYFPEIKLDSWTEKERSHHQSKSGIHFDFVWYQK